jgi:3-hydroxyisobutyrate dehydrogenase-like beta-hydroxyacid dehydrogenase
MNLGGNNMSKKVGFVGLGTMGFPMAVNLKKAGFDVIGFDAFKGIYEKAKAAGITMVETLNEVAVQADEAIISMVRDYAQNVDIIFGENGLLSAKPKNKTIIVMSTLDPESMNELGKRVEEESDLTLISAAVSGGASGAQAGTLSIMTAGSEDIVKSFQPYFEAMGSNIFYYGSEPGNSQVAKLVNNMILGINMNAIAEGLKLARHYNLPEEEIIKLLQVSTGDSWVVRNWRDVSNWTADTALAVLLKDLIAAYNQGIKHNIPLPFNALSSTQLFNSMDKEKPLYLESPKF